MKYTYREGIEKPRSPMWIFIPIIGLIIGVYLLVNAMAPGILYVVEPTDTTAKKLVSERPTLGEDRTYIPKINVDVAIVPIDGNEAAALEKGAIHRSPTSGNPKDGGNYVVAAHRFNLGFTPNQTKAQSPFYHIDRLNKDDDIYVDYKGIRYAYKVQERKFVEPDAVEIEKRTDDNRLTLYSCELSGPKSGREVVIAKPVGTIIWASGKPKLEAF